MADLKLAANAAHSTPRPLEQDQLEKVLEGSSLADVLATIPVVRQEARGTLVKHLRGDARQKDLASHALANAQNEIVREVLTGHAGEELAEALTAMFRGDDAAQMDAAAALLALTKNGKKAVAKAAGL